MDDPNAQLIEVDGWSNHIGRFGMVTSLSLEVQGPGPPYPSHPGASSCLGMFGACAGIFQDLVLLLISRVFSF